MQKQRGHIGWQGQFFLIRLSVIGTFFQAASQAKNRHFASVLADQIVDALNIGNDPMNCISYADAAEYSPFLDHFHVIAYFSSDKAMSFRAMKRRINSSMSLQVDMSYVFYPIHVTEFSLYCSEFTMCLLVKAGRKHQW
jgi:hypothetical protein